MDFTLIQELMNELIQYNFLPVIFFLVLFLVTNNKRIETSHKLYILIEISIPIHKVDEKK